MERATDIVQYVNLVLFVTVAVACFRIAWEHKNAPARWAALTFGLLAGLLVFGLVLPEDGELPLWVTKVFLLALVGFPFGLYRFSAAFRALPQRIDRLTVVFTAVVVAASLALPSLPDDDDARPAWFVAYLVAFIVNWVLLGVLAGRQLWRAGRGLATVARYRMRTLALGAVGLAIALIPAAVPESDQPLAVRVVTLILPAASALMFAVGFAPPRWLRAVWRRADQTALRAIELELITATERDQVFASVLPHAAALVGGNVATFTTAIAREAAEADPTTIKLPLADGHLVVEAGAHTPFFGQDELEMLQSLVAFVELVLERTTLLDREREARTSAERVNKELETLVYGISHDLKSPIISLLGYLEYLREDHGHKLGDEGRHFLDRMEKSATYMQDLLSDLLELSRIGRASVDVTDVDLTSLVSDVRVDVKAKFPHATVDIEELPVLSINAPRARQLFTNLVENAARHGGRDDITVRVFGKVREDGSAVVSVADNGVGIPAEYREKAFGIFERLTASESGAGTGIGLALCRKIVESAGGEIGIVDAPLGTHVRMMFPSGVVRDDSPKQLEVCQ